MEHVNDGNMFFMNMINSGIGWNNKIVKDHDDTKKKYISLLVSERDKITALERKNCDIDNTKTTTWSDYFEKIGVLLENNGKINELNSCVREMEEFIATNKTEIEKFDKCYNNISGSVLDNANEYKLKFIKCVCSYGLV